MINLLAMLHNKLTFSLMSMDKIARMYPAINIVEAVEKRNSLKLEFFKHVFKKWK